MESKKITKALKYFFTEEELRSIARQMAEQVLAVEDAEENKKTVTAQLAAEVKAAVSVLRETSQKHRAGFEYRPTECKEENDYKRGMVVITRLDTGEIVNERAMTVEERQLGLALVDPEEEA
ncbi:hypothetical protein M0R36_10870 [bacterium]|jgi:capsular polysaccharide biosynthesis protein|nr:hypothetical protein [bacterium]